MARQLILEGATAN